MSIVALTGWGQDRDKQRAFDAGFDEHLTKPAERQQLADMIRSPTKASIGSIQNGEFLAGYPTAPNALDLWNCSAQGR